MVKRANNRLYITGAVIVAVLVGAVILLSNGKEKAGTSNQEAVSSFRHAHGLAADVTDPTKLYIATHEGLFLLQNDKDLYRVGSKSDDYMGFSAHPTNANVFFTSGHPGGGGNLGFQKSEDGAKSWTRLSLGASGPVDFHAMAVGQVDPSLAYGSFAGALQRSTDGGVTWQVLKSNVSNVLSLTTDSKEKDSVYAATTAGLFVSKDQAQTFSQLGTLGAVRALAVNPTNNLELLSFSQSQGLAKSSDGGKTWNKQPFSGEAMFIAYSKPAPSTVYVLTEDNGISKSMDAGASWTKIR